jgi:ABC-type glycerol-3-phosphate transport system substrate-binding protein
LLAACAGSESKPAASEQPVTLLMVNSGAIPQGWSDLGRAFTREYPHLTVEFSGTEGGTWGQYFEKIAVGRPPTGCTAS